MNCKDTKICIRINSHEKDIWEMYARKIGYEHLAEFIRDTVNGVIEMGKSPTKKLIIIDNP